jgi:hypothetical protein
VVVQVGVNGDKGTASGVSCHQQYPMTRMWVVSAAGGPPTSGLAAERSTWRYDGRPGGMPLETFEDRLRAEFFKQKAKGAGGKHKLTVPVFLQQVPSWLDHEALEVWRERKCEVLAEPAAAEAGKSTVEWDAIGKLVQIFGQEFQKASAEMVVEILQLKRQPQETCRMLKARVKRLSRETGLLNELEQARKFVSALEAPLRAQVEPVLWGQSPGGIYTLDQALQVAERIDLARALSEGMLAEGRRQTGGTPKEVTAMAVTAGPAATVGCYRCGAHAHCAQECPISRDVVCTGCRKTAHMEAVCWSKDGQRRPEWAGRRGGAGAGGKPG